MERVGTLIDKLKDQFDQQAGADKLLVTARLLLAELLHQNMQQAPKGRVSVVLPTFVTAAEPPEAMDPIGTKPHHANRNNKKEDNTGWLFDPVVAIPTLAHQEQKEIYELNGVITEQESLNDKLREEKAEVATVLQGAPVRDLKKAIGINDRYLFMNELFRGDETMYERSLKTINAFSIYPEAEYWIQRELKVKLGWLEDNETVKLFDQLVRRRFS